ESRALSPRAASAAQSLLAATRATSAPRRRESLLGSERGEVWASLPLCARLRQPWWLVEEHPVQAQLADGLGELLEVDRLDDVAVDAQLVTLHDVALFAGGGEHDHREGPRLWIGLDAAQHLHAIDQRQLEIEQDHRGPIMQ